MVQLSHFDEQGESHMVDVGEKPKSKRVARASGVVRMQPATLSAICERSLSKGDVREVARLAGIMAAKRTGDLIPLCHPLAVESIALRIEPEGQNALRIESAVQITAKTGVEMEALTAVSVAALTVYDMCKSIDRGMVIERIQLESKSGGASGTFTRGAASCPSGDAPI